ncbi:MAG: SBBP repeat-containing protein [candidate division WOR-3 bacterium]
MDKSDCIVSLLSPIFNLSSDFCLLPSILLTFHFLLPTSYLFAQTPEWVYQYVNPNFSEVPYAITVDSFGNSYTTGYVGLGNNGGVGIIKLDNQGNEKWFYWNDLGTAIIGHSIMVYNDKVYVGGYMDSLGYERIVVISIDTLGNERWIYKDTLYNSEGYAIMISQSHHIYVAGIKYPSPPDWVVLKLDSLGSLCWRYVYDGPAGSYDEASSIVIDGNENIYVGGYSTGLGTNTDFTIIKLDSAGQEQWVYRYDGPASYRDEPRVLALDSLGNLYITGWSWGIDWDFCVVKIDTAGQERWVYRYNGLANSADYSYSLVVDDSGNVYVGGDSRDDTISLFTVIKIDSVGHERWRYLNRGPWGKGGGVACLTLDSQGHIYAGGGFTNPAWRGQIAVVKLNSAGESLWIYIYPHQPISPWTDCSRDMVTDIAGNIYLAGQINVSAWNDDIVVMKFAAPQGEVKEVVGSEPIAKNHCSAIFKDGIEFLPQADCGLEVYDVMGRMVVNKALQSGRKECIKLRSGVYFMCINSAEKMEHRKIVVLE